MPRTFLLAKKTQRSEVQIPHPAPKLFLPNKACLWLYLKIASLIENQNDLSWRVSSFTLEARFLVDELDRKNVALEFLRLAGLGKFKDGLRFFSPTCKTHNPYFSGNMDKLTDAMVQANAQGKAQYPNAEFTVKRALAEGEFVAVYTNLLNDKDKPEAGGLRQIHLFRFEGDEIVEYWDITQQISPDLPNSAGAF